MPDLLVRPQLLPPSSRAERVGSKWQEDSNAIAFAAIVDSTATRYRTRFEAAQHGPSPLESHGYHLMHALNDAPTVQASSRRTIVRECLRSLAGQTPALRQHKVKAHTSATPPPISDLAVEMLRTMIG